MRILLIEDDRQIADYIQKGLKEAGYTVLVTYDGREGLFLATGEEVDAIILDRMLPGLDGMDVLRMLRAAGRHDTGAIAELTGRCRAARGRPAPGSR
ncbi:MAG: response regulator [Polyangiaceae bacterium]